MNILLLNYEYPPLGGGAGNATYNYAREFVELGHTVVVLTSAYKKIFDYSNENGVHLYRIPALRKYQDRSNPFQMIAYNISSIVFCERIIKQYRIDKAIAFMSIPSGITALYVKKKYNVSYLISLQGGDVPGSQKNVTLLHKLISPLRKSILSNAKKVVAVSEGLAEKSNKIDKSNICVINAGVDITYFKPDIKTEKYNNFLYVGRFSEEKNITYIIKQFHLLHKDFPKMRLCLVGNGPKLPEIKALIAENDLCKVIDLFDWQEKNTLLKIYNCSDILINASFGEGMSNTILEAMSCGLVILASDVTGNNDLIKDQENGILFSLCEENSLYYKMKKLILDNNLMKILKHKSRETVCKKYTWEMSAKRYIDFLRTEVCK